MALIKDMVYFYHQQKEREILVDSIQYKTAAGASSVRWLKGI